jgi:hypothetical protein
MKTKLFALLLIFITISCEKDLPVLEERPDIPGEFQLVQTTTFSSLNGYTVTGTMEIWQQDTIYLFNFIDFSSSNGPDLVVWLRDGSGPGPVIDLGELKAIRGNFSYTYIDTAGEIASLSCALIWCDRFSVAFGKAAFAR